MANPKIIKSSHPAIPEFYNMTIEEMHEFKGGACYYCCDACNYDRHICHFCGDSLRHDNSRFKDPVGTPNPCYIDN